MGRHREQIFSITRESGQTPYNVRNTGSSDLLRQAETVSTDREVRHVLGQLGLADVDICALTLACSFLFTAEESKK